MLLSHFIEIFVFPLDRFVYIGPAGSWTPFHSDVFGSYSWSANIVGRKKWIFYPPGEEDFLKDSAGNPVYDVTDIRKCGTFFPSGTAATKQNN